MRSEDYSISILLPIFHKENNAANIAFLARALDSIFIQKFPSEFEVVVVDDGSASPVKDLDVFKRSGIDAKIRHVRLPRNYGLVFALNRALQVAKFSFVARIDADDSWEPGKLERQMELFGRDPNLTITATGMDLVDTSGALIERLIRPGAWSDIIRFFVEVGCPFPHGSVVAKKFVYKLLGGYSHDRRFVHCEDYALWGTWLRFFKPAMVEEALYKYTVSTDSISGQFGDVQRGASRLVCSNFHRLNFRDRLPGALESLASCLQTTVLEAGIVAYRMWRYQIPTLLPSEALDTLRIILPDRDLTCQQRSIPAWSIQEILEESNSAKRRRATGDVVVVPV